MKYKIVVGSQSYVEECVNEHLAKGWELYGDPFTTGGFIHQALIWPRGQG